MKNAPPIVFILAASRLWFTRCGIVFVLILGNRGKDAWGYLQISVLDELVGVGDVVVRQLQLYIDLVFWIIPQLNFRIWVGAVPKL